ncbi:MAG: gamma-glutamyl-gamma-aminobutyrate hydrolase family protein [Rhodospirillales bacterium]|nr:gamma-glutamyl-gamma-aminobutyrate hydrolase family protein [Rhodospirillales bacterium]
MPKKYQKSTKPMIGVPCSIGTVGNGRVDVHSAARRYVDVLEELCECIPVQIPALGNKFDFVDLVSRLDGIMLTGGRDNVEPFNYGGPPFPDDEVTDPDRDATVIGIIRAAVDAEVPIFGSCRGIQEMNVALGGSLHYRVHVLEGKMDHRMPRGENVPSEEIFKIRHMIKMTEGGLFADITGETEVMVNSLHAQAIDRLADSLEVEAVASDGIIEGVRLKNDKTFTVGVQWHAEHDPHGHKLSGGLYEKFAEAAHQRVKKRLG